MSKRLQALALIAAVPLAIAIAAYFAAGGDSGDERAGNPESREIDYDAALADAPPALAALYERGNELVDGGLPEYERTLESLSGYPVVANFWASWCGPCRLEFPYFQEQSARYGTEVAFLGVNSQDADRAAADFLEQLPVPYPSITDPNSDVWNAVGAVGLPVTAFYDAEGELVHLKHGEYRTEDDLVADIERYAR